MYLRFTGPGTVTRARVAAGLFKPAYDLWHAAGREADPVLLALRRELDWFCDRLPVPDRFCVRAKGIAWSDGVCWFRGDAREMVAHAYILAALIEECGVPIARSWTRDPGQVLYRDCFQVVAKPERRMLVRSRRRPGRFRIAAMRAGRGIQSNKRR